MRLGRKQPTEPQIDWESAEARTKAFSEALHEQLGACPSLEDKYQYLLYVTMLLGGFGSESDAQHQAVLYALASAREMVDRSNL